MTTAELIVVIGLVVVLVGVALASVNGIRDRRRASACRSELRTVQTAVAAYRALPGARRRTASLPPDLAALKAAGLLSRDVGRYVTYTRVRSGGRWVAQYVNGPDGNCLPR